MGPFVGHVGPVKVAGLSTPDSPQSLSMGPIIDNFLPI